MTDAVHEEPGRRLTKRVFLESLVCPRRGWLLHHADPHTTAPGPGEQFRFAQGNAIGALAREMLGPGVDLRGPATPDWVDEGRSVLANRTVRTAFEVPVVAAHAMARPDALIRDGDGWRVIEVKSGIRDRPAYVDDLAYTVAVVAAAGERVTAAELLLVNADWRVDNGQEPLVRLTVTEPVLARAAEFAPLLEPAYAIVAASGAPDAVLQAACRQCEFRGVRCFTDGPHDPVFELPSIRSKKVDEWIADGITRIPEVPATAKLTPVQQLHRRAVVAGGLIAVREALSRLSDIREPAVYLDFETLSLALPPFRGIAPFDVIPIQYSVHRRASGGNVDHRELLVDPAAPDVEEFARNLLGALSGAGSIVVYSSFERQRLNWLGRQVPALASDLEHAVGRLFDLLPVVQSAVAHPDFHGSLSIKKVLPVLVPDLSYATLAIGDGEAATGVIGLRAMGQVTDEEWERYRVQLLAYCKVDTLAMVRLHDALGALAREGA